VVREAPDLLGRLRAALLAAGLGPDGLLEIVPSDDPEGRTLAAGLVLLYPHPLARGPGDPRAAGAHATPSDAPGPLAPHLVLTQRTTTMRRHSGQISLPGGRYDLEDGSLLRTALRETQEELGVDPAGLTLWGRLEPEHIVATHYALAPFVAYAPRRPAFVPAPAEVAEVIDMPLALLLDPSTVEEEVWDFQGAERRVSFFRYREHKIWGATARILSQIVLLLDPARIDVAPFPGAAGETGRRLPPGDTWPRSVRPPAR
jgi:8-oxo-dGTP pyrophosphatase MutT (NUDIX family)